jgi:threonine dehydrogenase-like Zn-dependent dehydrogenase
VAIFGCGPIGLFSILLARNFGAAKIIAVDVLESNLQMAKECGAHEIILVKKNILKKNVWEPDTEVVDQIMKLTYGKGVDVSMEMAGAFSSVNNAIDSTRRGGNVIFFGIKDGDLVIPNFSRLVTRGLTIHNIIGREIFRTWQVAQRILNDKTNGIQETIWNVILKKGKGTILSFKDFTPENFEKSMNENPKIIFKIND